MRVGDPFPPPCPLYSRAPFDPFPLILRPAMQATLLRTNSSQFTFEENMINFKTRLQNRDCTARLAEKNFSEIKFFDRKMSLAKKN